MFLRVLKVKCKWPYLIKWHFLEKSFLRLFHYRLMLKTNYICQIYMVPIRSNLSYHQNHFEWMFNILCNLTNPAAVEKYNVVYILDINISLYFLSKNDMMNDKCCQQKFNIYFISNSIIDKGSILYSNRDSLDNINNPHCILANRKIFHLSCCQHSFNWTQWSIQLNYYFEWCKFRVQSEGIHL